eukprot:222841-Amphidinium_carterae.1
MLLAVPIGAAMEEDGQECEVALYTPGQIESGELAGVRLMVLPALYLVRRLVEGVPNHALVYFFSPDLSGASPAVTELFLLSEWASTMSTGTL